MENNIKKVIFIFILILLVSSSFVYAYWTDRVESRIDMGFKYEGYIDVFNIPEPVILPIPEEIIEGEDVNKETELENDGTELENGETELENPEENEEKPHNTEEKDDEPNNPVEPESSEDKVSSEVEGNTIDGEAESKDLVDKGAENELEYDEDKSGE